LSGYVGSKASIQGLQRWAVEILRDICESGCHASRRGK
jgi:hypothetical protein